MKRNGFTLIELLVVITIIGILAAVGLASYRVANQKARDSRRQADIVAIQSALEAYRTTNGQYPDSTQYDATSVVETDFDNQIYFSSGSKPVDPINSGTHVYGYTPVTLYTYELTYDLEGDAVGEKTVFNP
jgi:type II secretion system protein G